MSLLRRLFPSIPQSITVFLFWLLMAEEYDAASVVMATILAVAMPQVASRLEREFARLGSLGVLVPLGFRLLGDIVAANLTVARQVLGPEKALRPGFVWVPLDLTNIHGIAALSSIITLTPGTVTAELSEDRRHLLVHALDIDDPQRIIDEIKQKYEAPMLRVFP